MTCQAFRHDHLYAFMDGNLEASLAASVAQHLAQCPQCRMTVNASERIEERLRALWQAESVDDALWDRIQTRLDHVPRHLSAVEAAKRGTVPWKRVAAMAAMVALALSIALWWPFLPATATRQACLVSVPVDDLHTFVVSQRALDVAHTAPAALRQWFQEKVAFSPPLLPAQIDQASLVGGRLCHFLERRVASFMYQLSGHYLSIYVMPRQGLALPMGHGIKLHRVQATVHEVQGYHHMIWTQTDLLYSLVSDLPQEQLVRMAHALVQATWPDWRRET
jgi:anti-sigma factor RsiW